MTTTDPEPLQEKTPDTESPDTVPEVYDIPEAEKLAAQWEARHDLAAGRGSSDPMHVQHYLAHLRSEQALHEHSAAAVPKPRTPRRAETPSTGSWRRWARHD